MTSILVLSEIQKTLILKTCLFAINILELIKELGSLSMREIAKIM
jgi:hypothetical protein